MIEAVQLIQELHKDEIDELWEEVKDIDDDLYLVFYPTIIDEGGVVVDVYEIYYEDSQGYIVSEKVIIEYKDFKR